MVYMFSIAFERIKPDAGRVELSDAAFGATTTLLALLVLDNLLQLAAYGRGPYYRSLWNRVYSIVLVTQIVSQCLIPDISFVFLRAGKCVAAWIAVVVPELIWVVFTAGRVVLVLCKVEKFQPMILAIMKTFPRVLTVLGLYTVIVSFYALLGQSSLHLALNPVFRYISDIYHMLHQSLCDLQEMCSSGLSTRTWM